MFIFNLPITNIILNFISTKRKTRCISHFLGIDMRVIMTYIKNNVKKKDIMTLCKNIVQKDLLFIEICKQICDY